MTKAQRRQWHEAINGLSYKEIAEIVRQTYPPDMRRNKVDQIAREVIAGAHRVISPRSKVSR